MCSCGLECAGTGPASASGRAVSTGVVHWKTDSFPRTAESYSILETNIVTEPLLLSYITGCLLFIVRVEKALLVGGLGEKPSKVEPWHVQAACFLSFISSVPRRAVVKLVPSSSLFGGLIIPKTSESNSTAFSLLLYFSVLHTQPLVSPKLRGQVFAHVPRVCIFNMKDRIFLRLFSVRIWW